MAKTKVKAQRGKAKKKVTKKTTNFKGRTPGAKNKPKAKVYRVIGDNSFVLGDFATVDAARDAIAAQAALHLELRTPVPAEVSESDIDMMAEGEIEAPVQTPGASFMEYDWTIIVRRQEPNDVIHPEW